MPPPIQPALFAPAPAPKPLAGRLRTLALIANAACADTAALLAQAAGLAWWNARVLAAGADPQRLPPPAAPHLRLALPGAALAEAAAVGLELAALPIAEANAALGCLYTQALPGEQRTAHGVFYTPPELVRHLLDRAEAAGCRWQTDRVLDPACGAGAFLLQAAERMLAALPGADPAIALANIGSRLRGWEIDAMAAWLAQLSVELLLLPQMAASGRRPAPIAEVTDTLLAFQAGAGGWDVVVGNPPFGKVKDTPALRARFGRSLHGHPNLYGLFVDAAVHLARPDRGIVAYLMPASFLAGQYFRNLRRLLQQDAPPVSLDLIASRAGVFGDVLQEVALATFRRGDAAGCVQCAAVHMAEGAMQVEPTGAMHVPGDPHAAWLLPRSRADAALVAHLRRMPDRLADWGYEVATGPLVWNRHKPRLHATPSLGCVPVVWAESVTPDGRFALRSARRNHRPWFQPRGTDDPNVVRQACVLVQRTTAKEQSRRLIAAEMPAALLRQHQGVAVENHLNMIRPRAGRAKLPLRLLTAFLATQAADRVLRCISGSVAVSAAELQAMPLPPASAVLAAAQEPDFDAAVSRLYQSGAG